jgi:hypothetical protein
MTNTAVEQHFAGISVGIASYTAEVIYGETCINMMQFGFDNLKIIYFNF